MNLTNGQLTSVAYCWTLERRDGAGLGLTSHDRALTIDGTRFDPSPGMTPAAIHAEMGLDPRSSEVAGAVTSNSISEPDIAAGRWDGAGLRLFAVDWQDPGSERLELLSGELGQVNAKDCAFEVELLGAAAKLEQPICPLTSPICRAELGDSKCRVDMAGRRIRATVNSAEGNVVELSQPVDARFRFGRLRVLAGAANGERRTILGVDGHFLSLRSAPAAELEAGTPVEISEGCDKLFATCSARFGNAANFRGEPHLPGNDLLTRYPGA